MNIHSVCDTCAHVDICPRADLCNGCQDFRLDLGRCEERADYYDRIEDERREDAP